ncbi:MAG: hypothetical protein N2483_05545 [Burkholderiaceae bacterium]|nr:hypothetical protein [Burkholderiaceae bacterium]
MRPLRQHRSTPEYTRVQAWTAALFRVDTLQQAQATQAGEPNCGIR